MIQSDPYTRQQRHQIASIILVLAMLLLGTIGEMINPRNGLGSKWIFTPEILILLVAIIAIPFSLKRLSRLVQLREGVLRGTASAQLAREQPVPDAGALPVPAIIQLNRSRRLIVFIGVIVAVVLFIPFAIGLIVGANNTPHKTVSSDTSTVIVIVLIIAGAAVIGLLITLILIFWQMRRQLVYKIVADDQGLTSTYNGITSSICWSDARLFARISADKPSVPGIYELASLTTIVQWVDLPS